MLVPKEEQDKTMQKKGQQSWGVSNAGLCHRFLKDKNMCCMILYRKVSIKILLSQLEG